MHWCIGGFESKDSQSVDERLHSAYRRCKEDSYAIKLYLKITTTVVYHIILNWFINYNDPCFSIHWYQAQFNIFLLFNKDIDSIYVIQHDFNRIYIILSWIQDQSPFQKIFKNYFRIFFYDFCTWVSTCVKFAQNFWRFSVRFRGIITWNLTNWL